MKVISASVRSFRTFFSISGTVEMPGSELTSPLAVPLYGFGRAEMQVISASVRSFRTFFSISGTVEMPGSELTSPLAVGRGFRGGRGRGSRLPFVLFHSLCHPSVTFYIFRRPLSARSFPPTARTTLCPPPSFLRKTLRQSLNLRANFRQYADILVTEKKKTVKRLEKKSELVYNK